jgi:RHS repeat-associated protein
MIFNQSGSLAGVSRHDYLPFGEELFAGTGGRTLAQGYSAPDSVRQKFTQKERDIETGLDFSEARYYASTQGRFTSADDFLNDTSPVDPASWNLYAYVRNNPLRYTDPTGELIYAGDVTGADRDELLKRANYTYGCKDCVSVDKNGFLSVNTTGLSKDVLKATQYLTDAITSTDPSKLFAVQVTNNNSQVAFGDSQAGSAGVQLPGNNFKTSAVRIRLDFGDDKAVSGDKAVKDAFLNLVFAHEVAHFYPNHIEDPADARQTGPVVDAVNEIQQARGLPLRAQYGAFGRGNSGGFVSVEFGKANTDHAGNIVHNKAGGIEVNRTNKTVTWIKRTVGGTGIN